MELATDLWVSALLRRASLSGGFPVVVRRGDATAGAVLVKIVDSRARTARLYAEAAYDGAAVWMQPRPGATEPELDAYAERQARIDPDIWVVEIEDRDGRHFLTEPVDAS